MCTQHEYKQHHDFIVLHKSRLLIKLIVKSAQCINQQQSWDNQEAVCSQLKVHINLPKTALGRIMHEPLSAYLKPVESNKQTKDEV